MKKHTSTETEQKAEVQPQKTIRCRHCENIVTSPKAAIEPHEHRFCNPAGFSFHILCFSDAPGTLDVGIPTEADTWFEGYAWSFAICKQCNEHLGWWYAGTDRFVGLIATRLIVDDTTDGA